MRQTTRMAKQGESIMMTVRIIGIGMVVVFLTAIASMATVEILVRSLFLWSLLKGSKLC